MTFQSRGGWPSTGFDSPHAFGSVPDWGQMVMTQSSGLTARSLSQKLSSQSPASRAMHYPTVLGVDSFASTFVP